MLFSCLFACSSVLHSQMKDPAAFLRGGEKVPKIMIVGTFHFGYPGLDSHKTDEAYKVDVLSEKKQKEVKELVDYIAQYKPTKILVETGKNTGFLMHRYKAWKAGKYELKRKEIDQIALRLLDRFNLDTIYGIDANSMSRELYKSKDSLCTRPVLDRIYKAQDSALFVNKFEDRYWEWYDEEDVHTYEMKLLEYFKVMNSPAHIKRMHGHYILSDKTDNYNSVDGLLLNWYSRNLRIMKNIQMTQPTSEDRVLVLIGAGHAAILKQQFESTPEYELIEFGELKN